MAQLTTRAAGGVPQCIAQGDCAPRVAASRIFEGPLRRGPIAAAVVAGTRLAALVLVSMEQAMRRLPIATPSTSALLVASLLLAIAFGCGGRIPVGPVAPDDRDRPLGSTSFVSADSGQGSRGDFNGPPEAGEGDGEGEGEDRTVEEGDIYRVLGNGLIANLNAYRGLQLIDVSNPDEPTVIGRAQISGEPVELYERDGVVYVLMNDWSGYWGSRYSATLDVRTGGVVAAIDITAPDDPVVIDQEYVPGMIVTSRLTRGSSGAALYVAASDYGEVQGEGGVSTWAPRTMVRSFDVTEGALEPVGAVDLGGYISDIQATTGALLVARTDWSAAQSASTVALVDISDPRGALVQGAEVAVAGVVASQFNMDLTNGVLRVVSGSSWSGTQTNHVETFDANDLENVLPLDSATFGEGEQLYATLFLGNRAFFVTYLRVDPFHAFEIADDGTITERAEFVVSGWNDFFRAALGDTRLIGIGTNDEGARTMSVSLYDVTDLSNANPLLARADVAVDTSWSEASYDHRAFSVVEDAVSVAAPAGGATETGLVLLPYQGWDSTGQTYTTAVQIFTFSSTTLTRRGTMPHGTPVRRSFLADDELAANLSDAELSLYGTADPDVPLARGRVALAPNYVDVLPLPEGYLARVNGNADYYWYWWGSQADLPPNSIEVLAPGAHPDSAEAIATLEIPANAAVYASGPTLVVVDTRVLDYSTWPYQTESDVRVFDLSDPEVPVLASSFTTDRLQSAGYGGYGMVDCFDCGGWWYAPSTDVHAVPGALAFLSRHPMQESLGDVESCNTWPSYQEECVPAADGSMSCSYVGGGIYCTRPTDEQVATCSGSIQRCTYQASAEGEASEWQCVDVPVGDVETSTSCYTSEQFRYWTRLTVDVLDVRVPASAGLAPAVELPDHDEGVSARAQDSTLWLAFVRPVDVPGDAAAYVRWFARPLDLADPAAPAIGTAINVPGELLAVEGDNATTRDWLWSDDAIEVAVNQVSLDRDAGVATLLATRRFVDRYVSEVKLDGAGHVLVNHRATSWASDEVNHLAVLDEELNPLSDIEVDTWATLKDGVAGRALFQVPGGLLVMNLEDATAPFAQAFFALRGWPNSVRVFDRDVVMPAGRYGVYRFDLDEENLLGEVAPQ